ncbi:hypothetical protein [Solibacillus sp. FSL K6-1554]|uniref:hypothetical protein n=1 Tax=Solibacillus sp. FSL K6-1554 TaxID=2921472 RepID=UPI0030FC0169
MKLKIDEDWFLESLESDNVEVKFLAKAVIKLGAQAATNMVNQNLIDPRFTVRFDSDDPVLLFNDDNYSYLALDFHILVVNKPSQKWMQNALKIEVEKLFDIHEIEETEMQFKFHLNLDEAPYANCIKDIISNINEEIGPIVLKKLAALEIEDYQVQFSIMKFY